jgi:hypothetical protein
LFKNSFPFTISLPHPPLFLCWLPLPFHLRILCTLPVPGDSLNTLGVVVTLVVVIVLVIDSMAPSIAWCSGIRPVFIIIIVFDYLILLQWSNCQQVAWLVLRAAWWLILCSKIMSTVPREMLAGAVNHP